MADQALFTEMGYLVEQKQHESRRISLCKLLWMLPETGSHVGVCSPSQGASRTAELSRIDRSPRRQRVHSLLTALAGEADLSRFRLVIHFQATARISSVRFEVLGLSR